jgi:hypothetical protein
MIRREGWHTLKRLAFYGGRRGLSMLKQIPYMPTPLRGEDMPLAAGSASRSFQAAALSLATGLIGPP